MYSNKKVKIIIGIVALLMLSGIVYALFGTASGRRWLKNIQSDYGNGLNRTVTVYDYQGKEIKQYEGKFDIQYEDNRILFDDENGKRHQIIGGVTIIDEK